jgi:hypothetical protein
LYCDLARCEAYRKVPKLPLEIWLMILKIKRWTDRCIILNQFHENIEKSIVFTPPKKLFSEEEEEFFGGATGWIQSYYFRFNYTTYNYCTLTHSLPSPNLFELCILRREGEPCNYLQAKQHPDYYFHHFLNNPQCASVWISDGHPFPAIFYFNKVG